MIDHRLAARSYRFDQLDVEEQDADCDRKIADRGRHAAVKDRREARLRGKRYREDRAFPRICERHVEEKNDDVEEGKGNDQQRESDEVHDSRLSSCRPCDLARPFSGPPLQLHCDCSGRNVWSNGQTSFLGFRTWRPRYMPVLRSMWCGRRNSPESLSST